MLVGVAGDGDVREWWTAASEGVGWMALEGDLSG